MATDPIRLEMAARVREVREACGLSQDDVAQKLGMTKAGVSYWESGHPNLKMIRLVAEVFHATGRLEDPIEHIINFMIGTVDSFRVAPVPGRVVRFSRNGGGIRDANEGTTKETLPSTDDDTNELQAA